ncbi:hypothetical protein EW026_g3979 [Hermanssonia centrifuga]|uniref:SAC3/GANP/THP3 conserved domain-containing protein n=1 Tax=Hermanssonia centrifuga TaxID=98765 RepID=A0A4S4KIK6_9APHY|nr:hypothetical protein EW026_g3979 [Hermanssonia centrifuga]
MDDEESEAEVEEKGLDTPEEREKYYQELVKARDAERKKAIAEGKMDDPLVPKRLDEAITMVGTCMDMCPRFERYRRERENNLDRWEVIPGTKRVDHKRAVKIYERGAGDKTLPSELRPPPILKKTLDYLFHDLIARAGFSETYTFIRDRTRAVRSDFTILHETGPLAIECHDRCARYHILALHLERDRAGFSLDLEDQQLMFTLTSLRQFYEDQRGRYAAPTELEMLVYHRLIHMRDQRERHEDIPKEITSHPVFQLTTKFRLHVQARSAPITKKSALIVDAEGMQIFAELAAVLRQENNIVMIYLVACIMERLFGKDTIEDIDSIQGDLTIQEIIDGISRPVDIMTDPEVDSPVSEDIGFPIAAEPVQRSATEWLSSNFGSVPPTSALNQPAKSTNGTISSVFAPPVQPQTAQSAFSNLTATPNAFGPAVSVFGGSAFGAPKSVFGASVTPISALSDTHHLVSSPPKPAASASTSFSTTAPKEPSITSAHIPTHGTSSGSIFSVPLVAPTDPSKSLLGTANGSKHETATSSPYGMPQSSLPNPHAAAFTPSSYDISAIPQPREISQADVALAAPSSNLFPPPPPAVAPTRAPAVTPRLLAPLVLPEQPLPTIPQTPPQSRMVQRSQTLWDFPGLPPSLPYTPPTGTGSPTKVPSTPTPLSPSHPPQLSKAAPLPLPPTPTARWFDPSSQPKQLNSSLALRKQSLGLLSLQMPDAPTLPEILSPLSLPSPRPLQHQYADSPTPQRISEPVASTSRVSAEKTNSTTMSPSKGKGKEKDLDIDHDALIIKFLRSSCVVKRYFKLWKEKTIDRAAYAEACMRSDAYKEKVQRQRLSNSLNSIPNRKAADKKRRVSSDFAQTKRTRHKPREYRSALTDEELTQRLKENHKEHEKRWEQGSFLRTIRAQVARTVPEDIVPPHWRIWLSMNTENDGTAIWLQQKFDVPESGKWASGNVFSIPIIPKPSDLLPSGSPGLIVFERTPIGEVDDIIEKKYRILDDCSRLRDIIQDVRSQSKKRFLPALFVINWAETEVDVAPDFDDMVKNLIADKSISGYTNFVTSSNATDLDKKFSDALGSMVLDVEDKTTLIISWKGLTDSYIVPFRNFASDWLDSCWTNERETLDWSRYGEVVRSVEEVQTTLVQELLGLLHVPFDARVEMSVDLHDHAHLGEAYATGLFLDAILQTSLSRAEHALGSSLSEAYMLPRDRVEASRRRFEGTIQRVSERLRHLAAASLSSRSAQKRRATEEDSRSGSPSSVKRLKVSESPTATEYILEDNEGVQMNGIHITPPPSTSASTTAISELGQKPQVTIAMLRALAQGILKSD